MPFPANKQLGPYEVLAQLGAGAMGEVYRARDTRLGREVALKILPAEFSEDRERLNRFELEARSASALNHPNIITVYDIGSSNSTSYLSMELVDGRTLRELLRDGLLPLRKVVNIASQLADGLAKAHAAGIVHRDLKPENLMISKDGFLKILDFGLAKITAAPAMQASNFQTQTAAGMVVGTIGYMSPEQASGKSIDFRSDQFSFGTILYEMLAGKHPFRKDTGPETMEAIIRLEPEAVTAPAILRWILERCLAKDPEERYASTRDLARDFQAIRDHISEIDSSTAAAAILGQPTRRLRSLNPAFILMAFLVGIVAAYWFLQPGPQEPVKFTTITYSGKDLSPAVSPDRKLIAFRSHRDGTPRIWLKQLATGNETAVTAGPDDYPVFSSDGSSIYFIRTRNHVTSLYKTGVLGGDERKILDDVQSADCSTDGSRIAFVRWKSNDSMLFTANADGAGVNQLCYLKNKPIQFPRWSPDGKRIIAVSNFGSNASNTESILLVDAITKEQRWIRSTWPTAAIWLSNNEIAYGEAQSATPNGGGQVRSSATFVSENLSSGKIRSLFWFPSVGDLTDRLDEKSVVLESRGLRENLRQIGFSERSIADRWFTQGNSTDRQPVYSPDGNRILFSSIGGGNIDLMEVTVKTGALRRITDDAADDWDPAYTPDGKHILWSSNRGGHFEIWMADADGSGGHPVTSDGFDAENPTMTSDQRWIVYNSYHPEKRGLWKIHPDGSGAVQLVSGVTQFPEVSPDGIYAAYLSYKKTVLDESATIRVIDVSNGQIVSFEIPVRGDNFSGRARWTPNGKALAYIDQNKTGENGIFIQDFVPGKDTGASRRPIAGFNPGKPMETFGISPDGRFLTIAESEVYSSLVRVDTIPLR